MRSASDRTPHATPHSLPLPPSPYPLPPTPYPLPRTRPPAHLLTHPPTPHQAHLFRFLGLATFNQSAVDSTLLKAAPEALSRALHNFSAHETLFGGWPCLHQMLTSVEPRTFADGCAPLEEAAVAALPDEMARHAARGDFAGVLAAAKGKARQTHRIEKAHPSPVPRALAARAHEAPRPDPRAQ